MNVMRRIFNITCLLTLSALVLVACGSFAFQGEAQPSGDGGITITGDTQAVPQTAPNESSESGSPILGENAMLILFVLMGVGVLILVVLMVIGRSSGHAHS